MTSPKISNPLKMCNKLIWFKLFVIVTVCSSRASAEFEATETHSGRGFYSDNSLTRTVHHVLSQCLNKDDFVWCFKVQSAKILGRALKFQNINIIEGIALVKKNESELRSGRSSALDVKLNSRELENLSMKSLDSLLMERFLSFIRSRQLQVNMPRLLAFGKTNSQDLWQTIVDFFTLNTAASDESEGRKKKDDKKYLGPFIAAVMLKAAILKMAYHSIAIVAGKALLVGKIALIISSIIGLKKLVSNEGGEKTTYEIVKHPQVQQSHTYSSSHAGDYESGHDSSYHRSMDDEMMMQDKAYNAWVPSSA